MVPFEDSEELVVTSGLPSSAMIAIRNDHRLADPESSAKMVEVCERYLRGNQGTVERSEDDGTRTQSLDNKPR